MAQEWTDERIAQMLRKLNPYANYRLIGEVIEPGFKTVYNAMKGGDFTADTRLALVTLFVDLGITPESDLEELLDAARRIRERRDATRSRPSGENLADEGKKNLRRAAHPDDEEKNGEA